jgi:hypothetical protein
MFMATLLYYRHFELPLCTCTHDVPSLQETIRKAGMPVRPYGSNARQDWLSAALSMLASVGSRGAMKRNSKSLHEVHMKTSPLAVMHWPSEFSMWIMSPSARRRWLGLVDVDTATPAITINISFTNSILVRMCHHCYRKNLSAISANYYQS